MPVASLTADARLAARKAAGRSDFTKVAADIAIAVKKWHVAALAVAKKWPATERSSEAAGEARSAPGAPVAVLSCLAAVRAAARCSRAWA